MQSVAKNLDEMGFTTDAMQTQLKAITEKSIAALGTISVTGHKADAIGPLAAEISAGAVSVIDDMGFEYSADTAKAMISNITAGCIGGLDGIVMQDFDQNDLTSVTGHVASGATAALADLTTFGDSLTDSAAIDLVGAVTSSAVEAIDDIEMQGYTASDFSEMVSSIASAVTSNLDNRL
jgi:hypothetical protein